MAYYGSKKNHYSHTSEPVGEASNEKYVSGYTGLTAEQMDEHEDISIAVLCVAGDMYTNRDMMSTAKGDVNLTARSIMDMYSVNLVPSSEE